MKKAIWIFAAFLPVFSGVAQQKNNFRVGLIGFYNLENFFDTIDEPKVADEEFTPNSPKHYTSAVYWDKVGRLATVLSQIGTEVSPDGLSIVGVAEVENESVLRDLVQHEKLKSRNYKIVHYDSHDPRGIDVALLYNPKYFRVLFSHKLKVPVRNTRDVLWVSGVYAGDTIHVFVNHWSSRRGGQEASERLREEEASVPKYIVDSLAKINPNVKYIVMGDLNDDPINPSVVKILGAKQKIKEVQKGGMYNPFYDFYKKGIGTLAYRDAWNLFDQIMVSYGFLNTKQRGWFFRTAHIFKREFMMQQTGRYRGYPLRTWDGNSYNQGYSDHFPTYIELLEEVKQGQPAESSKKN